MTEHTVSLPLDYLSDLERKIYLEHLGSGETTVTALSDNLKIPYHTVSRVARKLIDKGYMIRSQRKGEDGSYSYFPVGREVSDLTPLAISIFQGAKISFKGEERTLEEVMVLISQNPAFFEESQDFEMLGLRFSAALNHLYWRALLNHNGQNPPKPNPHEIKVCLGNLIGEYREYVKVMEMILSLPIYEDGAITLRLFGPMNFNLSRDLEVYLQKEWNGPMTERTMGVHGRKVHKSFFQKVLDKFHSTYGESLPANQFEIKVTDEEAS